MISKRLKSLREDKDMSQKDLAGAIGVSPSTIGMYESNKRTPDSEMLNRLADFFDVSVDYLLGRTDKQKPSTNKINMKKEVETIAAHLQGKDITPKKMKLLKSYIDTLFDDFDDE
jgi:transcriptional regulator with XRE-family HTH domain